MRLIDVAVQSLTGKLREMYALSDRAYTLAIEAFRTQKDLTSEVYRLAELLKLHHLDVSSLMTEIIARFQPVASDLRYIRACGEVSYGFYRYGRYAFDITATIGVFGSVPGCDWSLIDEAGRKVREMMSLGMEAFEKRDVALAKRVIEMDDEVDEMYRSYLSRIISSQGDRRCDIARLLILRYLERIGDHSTAIAESVLYIVQG
ncbi:MAG: phosphate uptake regulator, PhoU [Thaumarchaeota archaeon]|nr:phosphate uptake regulator, PhoU [Candidatus Calditenuaceae archaeon]